MARTFRDNTGFMRHRKLRIAQGQRLNLLKLASFLLTMNPRRFTMATFRGSVHEERWCAPELNARRFRGHCGTIGCAIGQGPSAGIPRLRIEQKACVYTGRVTFADENWLTYSERVFGVKGCDPAYRFCFDDDWAVYDDSPEGAAYRICYALTRGIPRVACTPGEMRMNASGPVLRLGAQEWMEEFVITPPCARSLAKTVRGLDERLES